MNHARSAADFDMNTFAIMQVAAYFHSGGQEILDDHCLEDINCDFLTPSEQRGHQARRMKRQRIDEEGRRGHGQQDTG